ncbi:MAG: PfkB family carbohydrate kinase [Mycobacteriales bacterium]
MREIAVLGESLVDVVIRSDGSTEERPGGSPLNVAVGLARLGCSVQLYTSWGPDQHGRLLADHVAASGARVCLAPNAEPTSVAVARVDEQGRASYRFDLRWGLGPVPAFSPEPAALHFGSLAAILTPGAAAVSALVEQCAGWMLLSYDPNCRPSLTASTEDTRRMVEAHVRRSDLVKASDEDVAWLYPAEPLAGVARRWLDLGCGVVVITRGALGAQGWTARHTVGKHRPTP